MNDLIKNSEKIDQRVFPQILFILDQKKEINKAEKELLKSSLHNNPNYLHAPFGKPITKSLKINK